MKKNNRNNSKYEKKIEQLREIISNLSNEHDFSFDDLERESKDVFAHKTKKNTYAIPISIFSNNKLSSLETVTKYLREEMGCPYKKIAELLGRNHGPIGVTYRNSQNKLKRRLKIDFSFTIPISIFRDRKYSAFENIVNFLHTHEKKNFSQIARLLSRDPRTIWTVYERYRRKNEK